KSVPRRTSMGPIACRLACCLLAPSALLLAAAPSSSQSPETAIVLKTVKYAALGDIIRQLRGKVVIVDFWADTCVPCKREFPHLVEVHKKYAAEGFAAISVALDDPGNQVVREKLLKFLRGQRATFTNLVLDEKPEFWQEQLDISAVPAVFVFDREGKYRKFVGEDVNYAELEKLVVEWLKKK